MIDRVVDVLRLSDWVNDLPVFTNLERQAFARVQERQQIEVNATAAEHIKKNFDLGKFSGNEG